MPSPPRPARSRSARWREAFRWDHELWCQLPSGRGPPGLPSLRVLLRLDEHLVVAGWDRRTPSLHSPLRLSGTGGCLSSARWSRGARSATLHTRALTEHPRTRFVSRAFESFSPTRRRMRAGPTFVPFIAITGEFEADRRTPDEGTDRQDAPRSMPSSTSVSESSLLSPGRRGLDRRCPGGRNCCGNEGLRLPDQSVAGERGARPKRPHGAGAKLIWRKGDVAELGTGHRQD